MTSLRWIGLMFARLVALAVATVSGWMLFVNLADISYAGWVLAWILVSGLVGSVAGVVFLLSLDGPARFRTTRIRLWSWAGMTAAVLIPTSLSLFLLPMVLLAGLIASLSTSSDQGSGESITSG